AQRRHVSLGLVDLVLRFLDCLSLVLAVLQLAALGQIDQAIWADLHFPGACLSADGDKNRDVGDVQYMVEIALEPVVSEVLVSQVQERRITDQEPGSVCIDRDQGNEVKTRSALLNQFVLLTELRLDLAIDLKAAWFQNSILIDSLF